MNYHFFLKIKIIVFWTPHETTGFPLHVLHDINNYVEKIPYKEVTSHQVHSSIPSRVWKRNIYYYCHKNPPLIPALNQMNLANTHTLCFLK